MMFLANKCNKPLLLPVVCFKHDARPNCAGNPAYCASIDANASARARDSCRVVQRPPREPVRQYGYRYLCWQSAAAPGQTAARPETPLARVIPDHAGQSRNRQRFRTWHASAGVQLPTAELDTSARILIDDFPALPARAADAVAPNRSVQRAR